MFVVVVVIYFIKLFLFLFLLILMDSILSPGLCSCQECACGEAPPHPQTSGFAFGSSLEPPLKSRAMLPGSAFRLFFNPLASTETSQRIRSALSCVPFCFLPPLKNQSMRKGRSCCVCAAHGPALCRCEGVTCACTHVWRRGMLFLTSAPALVFLSMELGT